MTPEAEISEFVEGRKRSASEISAMQFAKQREARNQMLNPNPSRPAPAPDLVFKALLDLASVIAAKGAPQFLKELRDAAVEARTEQEKAKAAHATVAADVDAQLHDIANARASAEAALRQAKDELERYSQHARDEAMHKQGELDDREARIAAREKELDAREADLDKRFAAIRAAAR